MNRMLAVVAWLAAPVLLIGCTTGFNATYDHDPSQNFSSYRTFTWVGERPLMVAADQSLSPLLEGRLMNATRRELEAKGYSFVPYGRAADFAVSFTVGARDKIRVTSYPTTYHSGYGSWGWGRSYYGTTVDARQYTEGTLAVDVFDVQTRRPVWHGVATKSISRKDRENASETVAAAVTAVMGGFPPP